MSTAIMAARGNKKKKENKSCAYICVKRERHTGPGCARREQEPSCRPRSTRIVYTRSCRSQLVIDSRASSACGTRRSYDWGVGWWPNRWGSLKRETALLSPVSRPNENQLGKQQKICTDATHVEGEKTPSVSRGCKDGARGTDVG